MLKLNRNKVFSTSIGLIGLFIVVLFLNIREVSALSPDITQVKVPGNPAVYYLNHATGQRKVYINEAVFLDYGNDFNDVKTISPEELSKWAEARLIKTEGSKDLYYISSGKKVRINGLDDLRNYNLEMVSPITVSDFELSQYEETETYQSAGLDKTEGLNVSQVLVRNANYGQVLVPGTADNNVMIIRLSAGNEGASLQRLTFKLEGLFNDALIDEVYLLNSVTGERVRGGKSLRDRTLVLHVNPNEATITPNSTLELKVMLNLYNIAGVANQNLRFTLVDASSVEATHLATGAFPLHSSEFKMIEAGQILGSTRVDEQSLNGAGTQKNLGKFTITETSGREDVYIKELVFRNSGSASRRDLESFKLKQGERVVATARRMESNRIVFDVNYLRIPAGTSVDLSVSAILGTDYEAPRSVNLTLERSRVTGRTYELSLPTEIYNLEEEFILP
ncbi:MAG: hypothetical protein Q8Q67_02505 [bacterium]|nr:hypothetical protein [bacterium]